MKSDPQQSQHKYRFHYKCSIPNVIPAPSSSLAQPQLPGLTARSACRKICCVATQRQYYAHLPFLLRHFVARTINMLKRLLLVLPVLCGLPGANAIPALVTGSNITSSGLPQEQVGTPQVFSCDFGWNVDLDVMNQRWWRSRWGTWSWVPSQR